MKKSVLNRIEYLLSHHVSEVQSDKVEFASIQKRFGKKYRYKCETDLHGL